MVQKIHPRGVIWDPNSAPYVARFQILKLLSECSILEPSLGYVRLGPIKDCNQNEQEIALYASMSNMVFNLYFSFGREIHEIMLTQYLICRWLNLENDFHFEKRLKKLSLQ